MAYGLTGETFAPTPSDTLPHAVSRAFFAEFLFTFALVSVMLNTATTKSQAENSFFGLAIGFTVLAGAYTVGGISGGAFNPAVATGPTILHGIVNQGPFQHLWLYWVAELLASALASVVFRMTNDKEYMHQAAIAQERPVSSVQYAPLEPTQD
jgi:aquaporin Z